MKKISKEKTARIIPNAVGLCTEEGKHIFASLLSRDTTYKLMHRLVGSLRSRRVF